jgi:hypothetical protein
MTLEVISWWLGVGETLRDERAMATLVLQGSTAVRWSDPVSFPWFRAGLKTPASPPIPASSRTSVRALW